MIISLAIVIFLSVSIICFVSIIRDSMKYEFLVSRRKNVDNVRLAETLEAKIQSIEDLRTKINLMLIKNGFSK